MTKQPNLSVVADALDKTAPKSAAMAKAAIEGNLPYKNVPFKIDPELKELIRPLTEAEYDRLTNSILTDGVRDPIVIWKEEGVVVDGHNRMEIATGINIALPHVERSFPNKDKVKEWIIDNQLGRRNLTADEFNYLLGTRYNISKQEQGGPKDKAPDGMTTAERIAKDHGVTEKTVRRAGEVAKGVDLLAEVRGKAAKMKHLAGQGDLTNQELTEIAKAPTPQIAAKALDIIEKTKEKAKRQKAELVESRKPSNGAPTVYNVALCYHDSQKPPLAKDATVYIQTADEHLADAFDAVSRWGLEYQCSFVFEQKKDPFAGPYSKIVHSFLIVAVKGTVAGPKKNAIKKSVMQTEDTNKEIAGIINGYHENDKKLDFRGGGAIVPTGWVSVSK